MKILYRPHCGGLAEAMAKVKEFNTLKECFEYIVENTETWNNKKPFVLEDISIHYYGYDGRIEWETWVVCIDKYFSEDYLKKCHSPQAIVFLTFKD